MNTTAAVLEATELAEVVGADLGNDALKVVFNEKSHITIKNAVSLRMISEQRKQDLNFDGDSVEQGTVAQRILKNLDVIIRPAGGVEERFFIGDNAIKAGEDETVVGTAKADNPYIHIPFLAILAYYTPKSKKVARFKDISGLPIKQFNKDSRKKLKAKLLGTFDVTLLDAAGQPSRTVTIIIEDVAIAAEGVPVLVNQMMNHDATGIARPELGDGSYGVIDIGAFTTDLPVIVDGKPDSEASDGIDEGISTYIDKIASALSTASRATVTRNQILEKIISGDYETIRIRGKVYPLRSEVEGQLNFFAKKIVDVIDRMWSKNYEIQEFFVVGGGSKLLRPYLTKILNERGIELTFIEPKNKSDFQNDPQLQNAFGYWKLAKQKFGA
jgi:plasmid segregation protein ParM